MCWDCLDDNALAHDKFGAYLEKIGVKRELFKAAEALSRIKANDPKTTVIKRPVTQRSHWTNIEIQTRPLKLS